MKPLVVIAGPTASGKTSLAIKIARKFNGEIICADSRTVYKGMDIGTAKPTREEQSAVPHWGIDLVEPGERFTAADFQEYTYQKIAEIRSRGKLPILVGGTGLYIDAVVEGFEFGGDADAGFRESLERLALGQLYEYCAKNNINLPENKKNKRYVIRSIERKGISTKMNNKILDNIIVVGIATESSTLRKRIEDRAEQLFLNNIVNEAIILGKKYGWNNEAMTGNIYKLVEDYVSGLIDGDELKNKFVTSDWRLAKRQMAWLRRNSDLLWCDLDSAEHKIASDLSSMLQ